MPGVYGQALGIKLGHDIADDRLLEHYRTWTERAAETEADTAEDEDDLAEVQPAWIAGWDHTLTSDDAAAHQLDKERDGFAAALARMPGVAEVLHEDREVFHLRGTVEPEAVRAPRRPGWPSDSLSADPIRAR